MNDGIPAGIAKPTGEDAPEGFTKNSVTVFKGYFCKYVCQKSWNNFYEDVLLNEELRTNAKAIFNERTEEEFHNARYDNNADYARFRLPSSAGSVDQRGTTGKGSYLFENPQTK